MKHHAHGRRPFIAVTPDVTVPSADAPLPKYEMRVAYADAVLRGGGIPLVLPYSDDKATIDAVLDRCGGVVLTGGAFDVPPDFYGETPREGLGVIKLGRSRFELALLRSALARRMPVLGICGGMQLINVAFGGSLVQDLARELPSASPHEQKHDRTQPQHPVDVKDQSVVADCVGRGPLMVNSTHHQAVKVVGSGLVSSASAPDGVIEAIEATEGFVVGVQWHPELLIDTVPAHLGLFRTFINRARERRH